MSIGKKWSISLQRSLILMFPLLQSVERFRRRGYRVKRYFLHWVAIFCFIANFSYNESHESGLSYCGMSGFFALQTGHTNSLCISTKVHSMSGVWIASLDGLRLVYQHAKLKASSAQRSGLSCRYTHMMDSLIGRLFMAASTLICSFNSLRKMLSHIRCHSRARDPF